MKKLILCFVGLLLAAGSLFAKEQRFTLKSPDGKLVSHIVASAEEEITYDIVYKGVTVMLPSHLGLFESYRMILPRYKDAKISTTDNDDVICPPLPS